MFRELRRTRQALSAQDCADVLDRGSSGVLALLGDGGYPYAVPLNYVREGDKLYFHCAKEGHKIDAVRQEPRASFCVIDQDQVVPEEYTTYFRSAIAFGRVRVLEDEGEVRAAIDLLARRYHPGDSQEHRRETIQKEYSALCMLELTVEHLTGKEAIELVRARDRAEP